MDSGLFRRRRLPHWDVENGTYFVTSCLANSIPAQGLIELYRYRDELEARPIPRELTGPEWELRKHKLVFARFDELIDTRPAVTYLENPEAATIVRDSFYHFVGERYDLLAYVVMPSHFHWVFHPRPEWTASLELAQQPHAPVLPGGKPRQRTPRERIVQSIKQFTARKCNELLGRSGTFWQDEAYDHVVRDDGELSRIVEYVEHNPVKAGLASRPEDWRWSSATDRHDRKITPGEPLPK